MIWLEILDSGSLWLGGGSVLLGPDLCGRVFDRVLTKIEIL